ncbi:MAG: hypothetical protein JSU68_10725 [Phycisphaerales bacterium]|nr:MAG: hypothetical protein JSU68_10725 [Phycisphaerales bacterium]
MARDRLAENTRRERFSVATAWAGAVLAYPVLLVVAAIFLRGLLIIILAAGSYFLDRPDRVGISVMVAAVVVAAYILSKMIYMLSKTIYTGLRWRTIEHDGHHCGDCGYDLTGNVSGICPECGIRFRETGGAEPAP